MSAPVNLHATLITQNSVVLVWVSGAGRLSVRVNNIQVVTDLPTGTQTYTVTNLTPGTRYEFLVLDQYTEPSNTLIAFTLPSVPTVRDTTNVGPTTVTLNWNAVQGASHYQVVLGSGLNIIATLSSDKTSYNLSGLTVSTVYTTYGITASSDNTNFTAPAFISFSTVSAGVSSIQQVSSTTTSIVVHVSPGTGVSSGTVTSTGGSVSGSGPDYTISGLSPGSQYHITYTPNSGGAVYVDGLTTPPAPTGLKVKGFGNRATLSWNPVTVAGSPYLVINATPALPIQPLYISYPTGSAYTLTDLNPGQLYTFSLSFFQDNVGGTEGLRNSLDYQVTGFGINYLFSP